MQRAFERVRPAAATRLAVRLLALSLLLLLGSAYSLPALHHALVAHEVCAEHGEVHHVESGLSRSTGAAEEAENSARSEEGDHGHDHCAVAVVGAERVVFQTCAPAAQVQLGSAISLTRVGFASAKTSVSVLSYAPKLAPPV